MEHVPVKVTRSRVKVSNCASLHNEHVDHSLYFGPGVWHDIHAWALYADRDPAFEDGFRKHMLIQRERFPCKKCRVHLNSYMDAHPIPPRPNKSPYRDDDQAVERGVFFKWTVEFHNAVNERTSVEMRLKKPKCIYDPLHALKVFNSNVSSLTCEGCNNTNGK